MNFTGSRKQFGKKLVFIIENGKKELETQEFESFATGLKPRLLDKASRLLQDSSEAEDMVQETLLRLWTVRYRLKEYRSPEALALTILRNICLTHLSRSRRMTVGLPSELRLTPDESPSAQLRLEAEEMQAWLTDTIDGLPARQTLMMRMSTREGLSNAEIANILGVEEVTVRAQLSKARHNLLEKLKRK